MNLGKLKRFNIRRHKIGVIVFSVVVAIILQIILGSISKYSTEEKTVPVLIVKTEIKDETQIASDMYEQVYIRPINGQEYVSEGELKNYITNSKILIGEAITMGRLKDIKSKDENKKISYSIKLDPADCVAGTLRAGDEVNVIEAFGGNGTGISEYLFEEVPNVPTNIRVKEVYDANSSLIIGENSPASTIVLELDEEQGLALRVAELAKSIKLVLAKNQ